MPSLARAFPENRSCLAPQTSRAEGGQGRIFMAAKEVDAITS